MNLTPHSEVFSLMYTDLYCINFLFYSYSTGPLIWCDFENNYPALCGFTQMQNDDFDWKRYYGSTPSEDTGPDGDHTSGSGKQLD